MKPIDYGLSFVIGKSEWNEVRFWVESRTRIINESTGKHEDYIQCGSCKSEDTFAPKDLFMKDNYDFIPIFGPEHGVIFRRKANLNPNYKDCKPVDEMWEGQNYHLVEPLCSEVEDVFEANKSMRPIIAQTEIWNSDTKLRAIIEYPVKTLNTRKSTNIAQIDTGPIVFPDLSEHFELNVQRLWLAFVAFNAPDFADFIIEAPTRIEGADVYHYSKIVSLEATNRLFVL